MNAHPLMTIMLLSYLLGSIPFGYLLVRIFRGADVRTTGSGNIGATNVARTSPALGILTLLLDGAKGLLAVEIVLSVFPNGGALVFPAAFCAICGHVFPVWLGFRGGKGVATGLGAFLPLIPKSVLAAMLMFVVLFILVRRVALASILSAALLPVAVLLLGESRQGGGPVLEGGRNSVSMTPLLWVIASVVLIIGKHHQNIRRLLAGTEPRFSLKHK